MLCIKSEMVTSYRAGRLSSSIDLMMCTQPGVLQRLRYQQMHPPEMAGSTIARNQRPMFFEPSQDISPRFKH